MQQLVAFQADTGHLDADHNYKHCSNLGGWAADITSQYASWKSGAMRPSGEMIAMFDQLTKLGFQFNCLPILREQLILGGPLRCAAEVQGTARERARVNLCR
jgi:hypothetical protein